MEPNVRRIIADDSSREMVMSMNQRRLGDTFTALASGAALVVSFVSLWETALKEPDLQVFVGDNLGYTLDPWGREEVFVVPVTVTNSGARDGAVLGFELTVRNPATGASDRYQSSYSVDASYFGATDDVTVNRHRPKTPYAPVVVAGRTTYSGTLLFYPKAAGEKPLIEPKSDIELTLTLATPPPSGWLDRSFATVPRPVTISLAVPNFLPGALLTGDLARLRPKDAGAAK